jgi:hypothetical protein
MSNKANVVIQAVNLWTVKDLIRRVKNSSGIKEDTMALSAFSAFWAFLVFLVFSAFLAFSLFSAYLEFSPFLAFLYSQHSRLSWRSQSFQRPKEYFNPEADLMN